MGVDREHQGLAPRLVGAPHQGLPDLVRPEDVELEPVPEIGDRAGLGHPHIRHRALPERDPGRRGGARKTEIALMPEHAVETRRRDREGQGAAPPEDRPAEIAPRLVAQHARFEDPAVEGRAVSLERLFLVGAAFEILGAEPRQAPHRDGAKIADRLGARDRVAAEIGTPREARLVLARGRYGKKAHGVVSLDAAPASRGRCRWRSTARPRRRAPSSRSASRLRVKLSRRAFFSRPAESKTLLGA